MQAVNPHVYEILTGDSDTHIMARSGELVGFTPNLKRFVWRFGFCPGSEDAVAHKVNTVGRGFLWVICDINGRAPGTRFKDTDEVRHAFPTFWGFGCELPEEFKKIIDMRPETRKKKS
jgi:hypothetical protein